MAVTAVKDARVLSLPFSTVGQLTGEIASGTVQVCGFETLLVHVGTHDIPSPFSGSVKSIASIVADFEALFSVIRSLNPSCMIVFSAILPRPVDHLHSWYRVQQVNHGLRSLCFRKSNVVFNPSYKFFVSHGLPVPQYFSMDSLHLSQPGVSRLRQAFQQALSPVNLAKVNHCRKPR